MAKKKSTQSAATKKAATQSKKTTPSQTPKAEPSKPAVTERNISAEQIASVLVASGQATYFTVGQNHGRALRRLWDALWPELVAEAVRRENSGEALADRDMLKMWREWTKRGIPGTHGDWKYLAHWCGIAIPPTVTDEWIDDDLHPAMVFKKHANSRQLFELRKRNVHRQLAIKSNRARLEYLLNKTLSFLSRSHNNFFDHEIHSLARDIREDVGVICFEPRIDRLHFWLPWSEWSCGGSVVEPTHPVVVMVDPHRGTAKLHGIIGRKHANAVEQDVFDKVGDDLRLCVEDWLKFSKSFDVAEGFVTDKHQAHEEYVEINKAELRKILGKRDLIVRDGKKVRAGKIREMPESTFGDWLRGGKIPHQAIDNRTVKVQTTWLDEKVRLRDRDIAESADQVPASTD